ncbi:MAG: UvrD-helicase domain-containing protein [Planctomycetes bacterium]|nr:UvrD-helicase domain-containing protein [Planctomycetota bacterium]
MARRTPPPADSNLFDALPEPPTDSMKLSEEQRHAFGHPESRVISASAGTGKTHTLSAIYLGLLQGRVPYDGMDADAPPGLRPPQIVAVTFTEKAATELRERIRIRLEELRRLEPDPVRRTHLDRCRHELPGAPIQTIHGFCRTLLGEAGAQADVPRGFGMLEPADSRDLEERAYRETLAEALENESDPMLEQLAREWGVQHAFGGGVLEVARTLARQLARHVRTPEELLEAGDPEREQTDLRAHIESIHAAIAAAPPKGRSVPSEELRQLVAAGVPDGAAERLRRHVHALLSGASNASGKGLLKWAEKANLEPEFAAALSAAHAPYRAALLRYAAAARARYRAEKFRRGALDFDDLLSEARALLARIPALAARFRFVLIDEFQDTDPLQRDILFRIAFPPQGQTQRTRPRLAVVGDEKQSIYRFRGAEVSMMRQAAAELALCPLRENYRSRGAVLDYVNALFERSVWPPAATAVLAYDANHRLVRPASAPERHGWNGPAAEWLEAPKTEGGENAEQRRWRQARQLAQRIRTIVAPREGTALPRPVIWEKHDGRLERREAVRYGDIAILAGSLRHVRLPLEVWLTRFNIPFRMLGGASFYMRQDVLDVLNLLAAAADPTDRGALLGFLRSPFVPLSDGSIFRLAFDAASTEAAPKMELLDRIAAGDTRGLAGPEAEACAQAAALLKDLRARNGRATIAESIDRACQATGFLSVLALQPQGEVGVAAVRRLIETARRFEARGAQTLGDFVAWLREQADAERDDPGGGEERPDLEPDLPAHEEAVHIGTVHKAKGLEFPIVMLPDLSAPPNVRQPDALYRPDCGLGLSLGFAREGLPKQGDAAYARAKDAERAAEREESQRRLYVALTRAREYLVFCDDAPYAKKPANFDETWLAWLRAYEEIAVPLDLPAALRVAYDHPDLLAAAPAPSPSLLDWDADPPSVRAGVPGEAPAGEGKRLRALLESAQTLPAQAPRARVVEVSASALAKFLACPRRSAWDGHSIEDRPRERRHQDYEDRAEADESHERGAPDAVRALGTAAHAALEAAVRSGGSERTAVDAARQAWEAALAEEKSGPGAKRAAQAWKRIAATLGGAWGRAMLALPPERRFAERPFRWRADIEGGAVIVTGTLDALCADSSGGWQVVDYKLTSKQHLMQEGGGREALLRYAWQVGLYAFVAAKVLGVESQRVRPALLFLEDEPAEPCELHALPFDPPLRAGLSAATVEAGLKAFLAQHEGAEPKAEVYLPATEGPRAREPQRCRGEGCPYLARCFAL